MRQGLSGRLNNLMMNQLYGSQYIYQTTSWIDFHLFKTKLYLQHDLKTELIPRGMSSST